jgi:glycerate-2-kinase
VLSAGETTVTVRGHGKGGRNQEFALALAPLLARERRAVVCASAGTDGIDGPTDAAGAVVDNGTISRAQQRGCTSAQTTLDNNDAYTFFQVVGDLIHTGPTGTNVADIQVTLVGGMSR